MVSPSTITRAPRARTAEILRAGALVGDPGAVEVVIHAGGQARPDVLLAVE